MPDHYLSGGEQTTINAAITELYPALAFNSGATVTSADGMQEFISNIDLTANGAKKTFVNDSNVSKAEEYITKTADIRPAMKTTKLENAVGIKKWIDDYDHQRKVKEVKWTFREKPSGVDPGHAADIFLIFKDDKIKPTMLGVSLKAGTAKSKEAKMNSYVATIMRSHGIWKTKFPNALTELKNELWDKVYSQVPNLPTKGTNAVTKQNWVTLTGARQSRNKTLQEKILLLFEHNRPKFEELYVTMNLVCRNKLISMINDNGKGLECTKQWIVDNFNLPLTDMDPPLVLVKAVGTTAETQAASVRDFLPAVTKVHAYLQSGSVQEWFIDLQGQNNHKITLLMTTRSDTEYRAQKQNGKLGAFLMLKTQYRGTK
tara:strand:+ start:142 stop:1260 length:1119 start_codon:yes stop_codon:yes gene_type:complete